MPPASNLGSSLAIFAGGTLTFLTPLAKPGEVLLVVIAGPSAITTTPPSGWSLLATQSAANPASRTAIYRREVTSDEPSSHLFTVGAATPNACGIMLRYRDVSGSRAIVAQSQQARATASAAHAPPAISTTNYSDLVLLVFYGLDAAGNATLTPPAGSKLLTAEAHGPIGGGSLAVCELLLEAATTIGSQTGTWNSAVTGLAGAYALESIPVHFAKAIQAIPGGGIGLPVVGV